MQTKSSRIRMAGLVVAALAILAVTGFVFASHRANRISARGVSAKAAQPAANSADLANAFRKSALSFQVNEGQTDAQVRYLARGAGYELFLTPQEAVIALRHSATPRSMRDPRIRPAKKSAHRDADSVIRLQLAGANTDAQMSGIGALPGHVNYFTGNDPKNWRTNVPSFSAVKYQDIYPGVDLVFYGNQRRLEYDLIVAPGADPANIAFNVTGAKNLRINAHGDLAMQVAGGEVDLQKPAIYQERDGQKKEVAGNYALAANGSVKVVVDQYDATQPLVIDPVLDYSTFLGGSSDDIANGIAVDAAGDAYVAGTTMSTDFPTIPSGGHPNSTPAVFVAELNPGGTALLASTYLSGSGGDEGTAVAIDASGNVYVTGQTFSTDFPTTGSALIQSPLAANDAGTAFLTVLNGTTMVYSTYLGGTEGDEGWGVAADASQQAYVSGQAYPSSFTVGAAGTFNGTLTNANGSAFLARIDTTKTGAASLAYYTFLTGSGPGLFNPGGFPAEVAFAVAADSSQNAYVTGYTTSSDYPTTASAYLQTLAFSPDNGVVFVSKVNTGATGTASLVYSSFIAGPTSSGTGDFGLGIALGPTSGVAYLAGAVTSANYPSTTGSLQPALASPNGNGIVTLINTTASGSGSLQYSTFFGGTGGDTTTSLAVDTAGNVYAAGNTSSADLPFTPGAFQTSRTNANGEGLVLKLNPGGNGTADKLYATYLGGSGDGADADLAQGIAIDSNNNGYVTGQTVSGNFPHSAGVVQPALNGPSDAYVTELGLVAPLSASPNLLAFGTQLLNTSTASMTVTITNNSTGPLPVGFSVTGPNAGDFAATAGATTPCGGTLAAGASCTIGVIFTPTFVPAGAEAGTLLIGTAPNSTAVALTGTGSATGDFSLTVPATFNVTSGVAGTIPVMINGLQGFSGTVNLSCTGTTANVTSCTIPSTGMTGASVNASVTATRSFVQPVVTFQNPPATNLRQVVFLLIGIALFFMIPMTQRLRTRIGLATAMLVFVAVAGCAGGHPGSSTGGITITGTGTGATTGITHSYNVSLSISK
ncbi:MAG TPA: SBBP repeat-containing protein [Candidatus Acidoferrales bacterium]